MNALARLWAENAKVRIGVPLAVLAAAAAVSLYTSGDGPDPQLATARQGKKVQAKPKSATLLLAKEADTSDPQARMADRDFDCVVEPFQVVKLAPSAVGVIGHLNVERGDRIHKGEVLGTLEDRVENANLALARTKAQNLYTAGAIRAQLTFLRRNQERAEQLAQKKFVTLAKRDEAIANTDVAEQQLHEAELNEHSAQLEVGRAEQLLLQKRLISPFDGVVMDVLLRPGEYRDDKSPVLTLAQIDPLRVEVFVPTRYYGQISLSTTATVKPERPVGGTHSAKVTIVDSVVDAASGTFGVRLEMANRDGDVPAGLQCKVHFN